MDEVTLNDLLECSVCLERLDSSSKVLPCQHTFCKKCLQGIVEKHKELRCPECRVLVPIRIDDLPPNVLLVRILEGMKNAERAQDGADSSNSQSTSLKPNFNVSDTINHSKIGTEGETALQQTYARALYTYTAREEGDLSFNKGDIITIKKRIDNNWYYGEFGSKQGVLPISYVQVITPMPSNLPQCKALFDFKMINEDDEGCLTFYKNDVITVIRRIDENWAEGKLGEKVGIFPLAFVELNTLAQSLMKLSTNSLNTSKETPALPSTDKKDIHLPASYLSSQTELTGINNLPTITGLGNASSSTSTASSSPASSASKITPNPSISFSDRKTHNVIGGVDNHAVEKLFSLISLHPNTQNEKSANASKNEGTLPAVYMALYPYKPQKLDELELLKGSLYLVMQRCQDGWFKGRCMDGKSGVFPGNYVSRFTKTSNGTKAGGNAGNRGSTLQNSAKNPPDLPPRSGSPQVVKVSDLNSNSLASGSDRTEVHRHFGAKQSRHEKRHERRERKVTLFNKIKNARRSKSPLASSFSIDNPVFEDSTGTVKAAPIHIRSGSCPSQLLELQNVCELPTNSSGFLKHKDRIPARIPENPSTSLLKSENNHLHRKSSSLDAGNKSRPANQAQRQKFRCIVPYPPNSEYELELRVGDIIYVQRKRDDGWYKGTLQRTGKTGLFPANFVEEW